MLLPVSGLVELLIFLAAYLIVGGEVVLQAVKNIIRGQVFDENFLMALATIGAFGFGLSQVYFLFFVVLPAMRGKGEKAPQKPWEAAEGLEWEVPSPAPFHTFENPPRLDATATKVIG